MIHDYQTENSAVLECKHIKFLGGLVHWYKRHGKRTMCKECNKFRKIIGYIHSEVNQL